MAEIKQYVTVLLDNGSVQISEDVIGAIVAHSVSEVEGVVELSVKPVADIAELIGIKNWGKGIKITVDEDNSITIECNVIVAYGTNVVGVARNAQDAIKNAVESVTGVKVTSVNVNICGISRQ